MGDKFALNGYVDVASRLRLALMTHPQLTVNENPPEIRFIGDRCFIEVMVTVHRGPDDPAPVTAHAWEPFPGRTPYTRDSEMMNASTSALGRALGFMGFGIDRSLATVDEIRNRDGATDVPVEAPVRPVQAPQPSDMATDGPPPTERQLKTIHAMCRERGVAFEEFTPTTADDASRLIERLQSMPKRKY